MDLGIKVLYIEMNIFEYLLFSISSITRFIIRPLRRLRSNFEIPLLIFVLGFQESFFLALLALPKSVLTSRGLI